MERFFRLLDGDDLLNNIDRFSTTSEYILNQIYKDNNLLKYLINNFLKNKELISLSEHYDFFDKLVLYKSPSDNFRIRLHIFSGEKHNNRPHNHRWDYSSIILNGFYKQYIYGTESFINNELNPKDLSPILKHDMSQGSCCTLSHSIFHSIDVEPNTISLMIRGKSYKSRFLIFDKMTNSKWFEYEKDSETIEEINRKKISTQQIEKNLAKVYEIGLL
jgi:hypothetical protein